MAGLLLCEDLLFSSKVSATARAYDLQLRTARSPETLLKFAAEAWPTCVLFDLGHSTSNIDELATELKKRGPVYLVAFGSHVDTARLQAAHDAGCDLVLTRGNFVNLLDANLAAWFAGRES